jgi:putative NIF3 family GTP cyclohydrolase 1 type 2
MVILLIKLTHIFTMSITIKQIIDCIEAKAPLFYQESYDNSGVQVGNIHQEVSSVLTTLDITLAVIDEAIARKCNLIIAHHPLIFSGIKKITMHNKSYSKQYCVICSPY